MKKVSYTAEKQVQNRAFTCLKVFFGGTMDKKGLFSVGALRVRISTVAKKSRPVSKFCYLEEKVQVTTILLVFSLQKSVKYIRSKMISKFGIF